MIQSQEFFFWRRGAAAELESNGAVDKKHDRGNFPAVSHDRGKLRKMTNIVYLVLPHRCRDYRSG